MPDTETMSAPIETRAFGELIGALLNEQCDLTAVERFAQFHEDATGPLQSRFYSALLPGRTPGPGEQYAFEVDLDRCSGCKACVAACHSLNGLDDGEAWREVGLIIGGPPDLPVLQHVTSACHHCLEPACLSACPVDAYEKDPVTGIVRHLDDQCFGCRYCMLACPYDVPKFHAGKGIVRKCDMCADRLKVGEAPACVQGCPHEAIRIRVIDQADVAALADARGFLPAAPDPSYTLPTTRYVTLRPLQGAVRAADHHHSEPEHAHAPLVVMLVLTQAAAGGFLADFLSRVTGQGSHWGLPALSVALGLVGIAASVLHLGRPLYAYRAIVGLRHSWLSREVLAFGLFAKLGLVHAGVAFLRPGLALASAAGVSVAGVAAVVCSVMVYHVVRRPFWQAGITGVKFAGTALVAGLGMWLAVRGGDRAIGFALAVASVIRLAADCAILLHRHDARLSPLRRTAELLTGPLKRISTLRLGLGIVGGIVLPLCVAVMGDSLPSDVRRVVSVLGLAALLGGEFAERALFFMAVVRPKMPGGMPS
ncbi:MAG: dimethyl sulfoxide reductase anchor subunit [Isosphaeraceae bacterium]|nr:dimethyl sulfoxide reductase anchor subunit [Isosphaeraceae bacterium]